MGVGAVAGILAGVGSLASAGASIYSSSQSGKGGAAGGQVPWDVLHRLAHMNLGSVPQAAQYQPVNFDQEQIGNILANTNSLTDINNLMQPTNAMITKDAISRANKLIPGYTPAMQRMGANAVDLLNGRLPTNDIQSLVTQAGQSANAINVPGLAGNATLRDLGISQLQAEQSGSGMLNDMVNMAQTVSPRGSYLTPQSYMTNPSQQAEFDTAQNQLIQQSQQNAYNLAAAPDPNAQAQAQLLVGSSLMPRQGGGVAANLAGIGSSVGGGLAQLGNAWGNSASNSYSSSDGMNNAGFYTSPGAFNSAFPTTGQYQPIMGQSNGGYYFGGYNTVPTAS